MKEAEIRPQDLFNQYLALARRDIEEFFSERDRFVTVPCPACRSTEIHDGLEKLGLRYLICRVCDSLYLSPRPTPVMLAEFYRRGASVEFWETDFFRQTAEARRARIFKPRAELISQLLASSPAAGRQRVLADIGSGYGIFLEEVALRHLFDEVVGIEPAPNLAAICRARGFRVIEKPAEEVTAEDLVASFATAFEVLEHLFDPGLFLSAVCNFLEPGGVLVFTTLAVSGFDIQVLWEHSKSVYPPHHLNLLSVNGLEQLVRRTGFELEDLSTPGELDVDIVFNALTEDPTIPVPRFVRQLLRMPDNVTADFQAFLKTHRLSSHVRVVARRPSPPGHPGRVL